jgi:mono/diheme cytochrome c family protein
VLAALSAGQKTGIALVAAAFVVFALSSAFLFPRFSPNFPGRHVKLFGFVAVLFTVGMLSAIVGFGKEKSEKTAESTTATATSPPTAPSTTTPAKPAGDPAAGKALFAQQGCASCHTFKPANANGKVGPDLDNLKADAAKANRGDEVAYTHESIQDPNAYVVPGFQPNVMPDFGKMLSPKQIDDLVAFLTQG